MLTLLKQRVRRAASRLGSLLPRRSSHTAARVLRPWYDDWVRTHPLTGFTPARAVAMLHAADGGTPAEQFELFAEMLDKWPRLAAVEATRRLALTGLEWEILPCEERGAAGSPPAGRALAATCGSQSPRGPQSPSTAFHAGEHAPRSPHGPQSPSTASRTATAGDARATLAGTDSRATQAAEYCRETLSCLDGFRAALHHLASAIGFGIAVCEIVWERGRLLDLVPVPHSRLVADPREPWRLCVRTEEDQAFGLPLDAQPNKWIVHRPRSRAARHFDGGLLRPTTLLFIAQNMSLKDWLIYSQVAGIPARVAQFEPGMPDAEKAQLIQSLNNLGKDASAVFSKAVDLKFLEAARGDKPYQSIQDYCNIEATILWLGQHLTTDIRTSGSRPRVAVRGSKSSADGADVHAGTHGATVIEGGNGAHAARRPRRT